MSKPPHPPHTRSGNFGKLTSEIPEREVADGLMGCYSYDRSKYLLNERSNEAADSRVRIP